MPTVSLKDAKAGFSSLVDEAIKGAFVTITRHGKPAAVLVSVEAARRTSPAGRSKKASGPRRVPANLSRR